LCYTTQVWRFRRESYQALRFPPRRLPLFLLGVSPGVETATSLPVVFLVDLAQVILLSYLVVRSRYSGWKLYLATFTVFLGVTVALTVLAALIEQRPDEVGICTESLCSP